MTMPPISALKKVDKKLANALVEVNKSNVDKELKSLRKTWSTKGKSATVFELKDRILGCKTTMTEETMI